MDQIEQLENSSKVPDYLKTLSSRLVYALKKLGISQAELARAIDVKPQAIHYLCNSNANKSSFTYEIAEALKINSLWLAIGEGKFKDEKLNYTLEGYKKIPILPWEELAKKNTQQIDFNLFNTNQEYLLINSSVHNAHFALRLNDKSMFPRFDPNTILIIDNQRKAECQDFVIVYINEIKDLIFRQLEINNSKMLLKPYNTNMYKTILMTKVDIILGVMVEARTQF